MKWSYTASVRATACSSIMGALARTSPLASSSRPTKEAISSILAGQLTTYLMAGLHLKDKEGKDGRRRGARAGQGGS